MATTKHLNIDDYIAAQVEEVRPMLEEIRTLVHQLVPDAEETIKYDMPTFMLGGKNFVYFSAFKNHIGFYPAPTHDKKYTADLEGYKTGKGSIQFPLGKPMPLPLIKKIIDWRQKEMAR